MLNKTILFSGRFDRPHISHLETITILGQQYKKVLVVVLDYPEQTYPVQYRAQKLKDILSRCKGCYDVVINKIHFGEITKEEIKKYKFDIYGSGNMKVLKHIEEIGCNVLYIQRSDDTNATDDRKYQKIKEIMHE